MKNFGYVILAAAGLFVLALLFVPKLLTQLKLHVMGSTEQKAALKTKSDAFGVDIAAIDAPKAA